MSVLRSAATATGADTPDTRQPRTASRDEGAVTARAASRPLDLMTGEGLGRLDFTPLREFGTFLQSRDRGQAEIQSVTVSVRGPLPTRVEWVQQRLTKSGFATRPCP